LLKPDIPRFGVRQFCSSRCDYIRDKQLLTVSVLCRTNNRFKKECDYNFIMCTKKLSHLDDTGQARMVNVGSKPDTNRVAIAKGEIHLLPETLRLITEGLLKKGDILTVAKIAGIMAAKKTAELIPLCHTIPLHQVEVDLMVDESLPGVRIESRVFTTGKTGVEMEALTAVSVTALTIYDMVKAVEKTGRIQNIRLVEKHGGQSGDVYNE